MVFVDQWRILNIFYQLDLNTATSHEELEMSWTILSWEENHNVVVHLPPMNIDVWVVASSSTYYKGPPTRLKKKNQDEFPSKKKIQPVQDSPFLLDSLVDTVHYGERREET